MIGKALLLLLLTALCPPGCVGGLDSSADEGRAADLVAYSFDDSVSLEIQGTIEAALNEWSSRLPVKFEKCGLQSRHCVAFSFVEQNHGDMAPFSFLERSLAHTLFRGAYPSEVHFNKEMLSDDGLDLHDIFQVALHEVGHVLGIPHSSDPRSIMFPDRRKGAGTQEILTSDLEAFGRIQKNSRPLKIQRAGSPSKDEPAPESDFHVENLFQRFLALSAHQCSWLASSENTAPNY